MADKITVTSIGHEEVYGEMYRCDNCDKLSFGQNYCPHRGGIIVGRNPEEEE